MASIIGNYSHVKNENLDEYFKAIGIILKFMQINFFFNFEIKTLKHFTGVPFIPRKMMMMTSPRLEISKSEDETWTIKIITTIRTTELTFKIGEKFEESMPAGVTLKVIILFNKTRVFYCFNEN